MIFKLDYQTIYLFYALISLVNAYCLTLMWFEHRKRYKGLFLWVLYFLLQMSAYVLLIFEERCNLFVSKVLANEVNILGLICFCLGFQSFLKIKKKCKLIWLLATLEFFVLVYFTYGVDELKYRLLSTSITVVLLGLSLLYFLSRNATTIQRNIIKPAIVLLGLMIEFNGLRMIIILTQAYTYKNLLDAPFWVGFSEVLIILLNVIMVVNLTRIVDRQLQHDILEQEKKFNLTFQVSPHAIAILDRVGLCFVEINQTFINMFGYTKEEVISKQTHEVNLTALGDHISDFMNQTHLSQTHSLEMVLSHKDGTKKHVQVSIVLDKLSGKEVVISTLEDITEIIQARSKMVRLANYDALTELPNRYLLKDRFELAIANADRSHTSVAVMVIDIDDFKDFNDEFGHNFGDQVLISVSSRISKLIRKVDTLSRFGGDEFIILLSNLKSIEDVTIFSERLLALFKEPHKIGGKSTCVHISVGAAIYPESGQNLDTLLRKADEVMYQVKNTTKAGFKLYQ